MLNSVFGISLISGLPLISIFMITAIAALISERAGVINIGLEGQMVFAGFGYSLVTYRHYDVNNLNNHHLAVIAIIVGILFGMIISLLHSLMVLKFKINHIISGTVVNVAGSAIAAMGATLLNNRANISSNIQYIPWKIDSLIFYPFIILIIVIAIICLLVFSKFGLRLKSVGENPWASESVGINVIRYKFVAITISGALAGLSGSLYVITQNIFMPTAGGYGFIAIAIMILARWNGWFIILSSFILGYVIQLTYEAAAVPDITKHINPQLLKSLIYLSPLVSLLIFRFIYNKKITGAPSALGINYSVDSC